MVADPGMELEKNTALNGLGFLLSTNKRFFIYAQTPLLCHPKLVILDLPLTCIASFTLSAFNKVSKFALNFQIHIA